MLNKLATAAITLYQRYISPHKGYCCAHRAYTGEDSCSQYAKVAITENGFFSAFPLIREQFNKCNFAAEQMRKERKKKSKNKDSACDECIPSCDAFSTCDTIGDCHPFH